MASTPPYNVPLAAALGRSEPLGLLLKRLRESQARLASIGPLLPAAMRSAISPGPLDETAWVLLVHNAAVAAKLRQMVPALQAALLTAGHGDTPIKIKVMASSR